MAMRELGENPGSECPIGQIWPHEAHNFTVWLAQQGRLGCLGDALGLDLEIVSKARARHQLVGFLAGHTGKGNE